MVKLSTGQEYNPQVKTKLKQTFSKENFKNIAGNAMTGMKTAARSGIAQGSGLLLDSFIGEWAGDWARSKADKDDSDESSKMKLKDYFKIFKAEIDDLLGKTVTRVESLKDVSSDIRQEMEKTQKMPTISPAATVVPGEGLSALGVSSGVDLEELISEMKRTSEDELLRYIEENQINDEKLIHDLIEATHAANIEVEKGLRNQFKQEVANSKTLERIAAATESTHKEIAKANQDIYKADETGNVQEDQKQEEKKGGIFDAIKGLLPGMSNLFGGLKGAIGSMATTIGTSIASLGGLFGAKKILDVAGSVPDVPGTAKRTPGKGILSKTVSGAGNVAKSAGSKALNIAKVLGRAAGPVAAVAGAGLAGWEAGKLINKTLESNNINLGSMAYDGVDVIKGSTLGNMFGFKSDEQKRIQAEEASKMAIQQKKAQQIATTSAQQAQTAQMISGTSELAKKEVATSAPVIVNAPSTNIAGGSKGSGEILNYNSQNTDNTFRRLNEKSFGFAYI